jgi:Na+-transporting methylmalonyl-CoA/oxaloacetate decarboxylase gamma subunit
MEILNINWSNAFVVAGLGMGVVFVLLAMLVFLLNCFSYLFIKKKKQTTEMPIITANNVFTEAETAAIATTLHLFYQDMHDEESGVITINKKITLWNSKIFGLNTFSR